MAEFSTTKTPTLEKLAADMYQEMEKGLSGQQSSLLMIPTYIHQLPNGSESGNFLALGNGMICGICVFDLISYTVKPLFTMPPFTVAHSFPPNTGFM